MNEELWKNGKLNEEYVDLIYKAFKKIDGNIGSEFLREGAKGKKELLSPTLANRAKAALLAQPDLAFYKKLKKYIDSDAGLLAFSIKGEEDQILRGFQFVGGMEGHHYLHQNVMQWFQDITKGKGAKTGIKKALTAMKRFRDEGGTSGVVWDNLFPLSRRGHSAGTLLKDVVDGVRSSGKAVSAHLNIVTDKADTGMYAGGFDRPSGLIGEGKEFIPNQIFKDSDSIEFMVEQMKNFAYDPSKMMTKVAALNEQESTARKFISKLAGVDLENIKDPSLLKKYREIISGKEGFNLDINDIVHRLSQGMKLPDLDKIDMNLIDKGQGGIINLLRELNKNPNLSSSVIKARLSKLNKLKPALKGGGKIPGLAGKFFKIGEIGLELLTGIPVLADLTHEAKTPFERYYEGASTSNWSDIANVADSASLVTGLAAIPSGGTSVLPSFGFGLLGGTARMIAEGDKRRHEEIFYRYLKEDKYIPANTHLPEDDPQYGVAEIKQWDPKQENIDASIEALGNYAF